MTRKMRSGPRHRARAATNTINSGQRNPKAPTLPIARALLFPATGRRGLDAAVVTRCPWCRRTHLHRGVDLNGAIRESGCTPAREYLLAVKR